MEGIKIHASFLPVYHTKYYNGSEGREKSLCKDKQYQLQVAKTLYQMEAFQFLICFEGMHVF